MYPILWSVCYMNPSIFIETANYLSLRFCDHIKLYALYIEMSIIIISLEQIKLTRCTKECALTDRKINPVLHITLRT
jgi:hypothetical protein